MQAALNAASDGDELVLADGTYTGSGDNVLEITSTKSITIRALNVGQAVVDGENARRGIRVACTCTVIVAGLRITGGDPVRSTRTQTSSHGPDEVPPH